MSKIYPEPSLIIMFRNIQGLTQTDLADAVGVAMQSVHRWESGKSNLNGQYISKVVEALKCDVWDLFPKNTKDIIDKALARTDKYISKKELDNDSAARLAFDILKDARMFGLVETDKVKDGAVITSVSDLIHIYGEPNPDRMKIPMVDDLIPVTDNSSDNVKGFFTSQEEIVAVNGPRNCGKTFDILLYLLWLCENIPDIQIGVCRAEKSGIGATIFPSLKLMLKFPYAEDPRNPFRIVGGLEHPDKIRFDNGAEMDFFGLYSEKQQRGKQKHVIFMNQAEIEKDKSNFSSLIAGMTGERMGPITKPAGHNWEWRLIMDLNPDLPLHWTWQGKLAGEYEWWDFKHHDHPKYWDFIEQEYTAAGKKVREDIKRAYPPGHTRDRMLDGLFVGAEGLVLNCFDPAKHVLAKKDQPDIDSAWKHYRSTDWAYGGAHVTLWISTDYDDVSYVWQEYAKSESRVAEHAEFIKLHSRDLHYTSHFADSEDASARAEFGELGIATRTVNKDVKAGINTLNKLFAEDKLFIFEDARINQDTLMVNKGYPKDILAELAQLRYSDKKTGTSEDYLPDKDCKKDRFDALRYWAVGVYGVKEYVHLEPTTM